MKHESLKNVIVLAFVVGVSFTSVDASFAILKNLLKKNNVGLVQSGQLGSISKQISILEETEQELHSQLKSDTEVLELLSNRITEFKRQIENATEARNEIDKEFLVKKLSIVSRSYQNAIEAMQIREQMISLLKKHATLLAEYQEDPSFDKIRLPGKAITNFEDLQKSAQSLFTNMQELDRLKHFRDNAERDSEKRKRVLDVSVKEYEAKQLEHKAFDKDSKALPELEAFSRSQQGEIIDAQFQQLGYKKEATQQKLFKKSTINRCIKTWKWPK